MEKERSISYGTTSEKQFIQKLGLHSREKKCTTEEHLRHLKKYLDLMKVRAQWGFIDRWEIERFVAKRIEYLATK